MLRRIRAKEFLLSAAMVIHTCRSHGHVAGVWCTQIPTLDPQNGIHGGFCHYARLHSSRANVSAARFRLWKDTTGVFSRRVDFLRMQPLQEVVGRSRR